MMRKFIKRIVIYLSKNNSYIRNFHLNSSFLRTPIGLSIINFIFQKIFRINSNVDIPVNFTSRITAYNNIKHAKDKTTKLSFAISGGCYIQGINGIEIGNNFLFAPGIKIISANHNSKNHDISDVTNKIVIGNNVWMGTNSIILPGVTVGDCCIIAAGSVVTKSFPESHLIIGGNPAKILKRIDP